MSQTFKDRLLLYLRRNKVAIRSFEKTCGLSNSYIANLGNFPSAEKLRIILDNCPDVNQLWLLTGEGEMLQSDDLAAPQNNDLVPELPIDAAAGFTDDIQQGVSPSMCAMLPRIPGIPGYDLTMHVRGDSMQPTFESGDRLAIRRCYDFIEWGVPHVLDTTEGVYLKRIREDRDNILCHSDNADYPPFPIPKSCIRGIYKVVALLRVC